MDRTAARDALFTLVTDEVAGVCPAIIGTLPEVQYQGIKYPEVPAADAYWLRISLQTVGEDQTSLRNNVRRFATDGLIFVQLFCPVTDKQAGARMDQIAEALRNLFRRRAPTDTIEFTRARIVDNIAPEPNWFRANVVSEFQYRQFL